MEKRFCAPSPPIKLIARVSINTSHDQPDALGDLIASGVFPFLQLESVPVAIAHEGMTQQRSLTLADMKQV